MDSKQKNQDQIMATVEEEEEEEKELQVVNTNFQYLNYLKHKLLSHNSSGLNDNPTPSDEKETSGTNENVKQEWNNFKK